MFHHRAKAVWGVYRKPRTPECVVFQVERSRLCNFRGADEGEERRKEQPEGPHFSCYPLLRKLVSALFNIFSLNLFICLAIVLSHWHFWYWIQYNLNASHGRPGETRCFMRVKSSTNVVESIKKSNCWLTKDFEFFHYVLITYNGVELIFLMILKHE